MNYPAEMNIPGTFNLTVEYWQWRSLEHDKRGREKWRLLRYRMTEADAAAFAKKNGLTLEKVPDSAELRKDIRGTMVSGGVMKAPGFGD